MLLVRAGDSWCALPLQRVRRVLPASPLHPLPGAEAQIAGLAEVDGEPLVVLDLEKLLGAPTGAGAELPVTLLVATGAADDTEIVGLAADEAGDLVGLPEDAIAGPADGVVRGTAEANGKLVRILDLIALGEVA